MSLVKKNNLIKEKASIELMIAAPPGRLGKPYKGKTLRTALGQWVRHYCGQVVCRMQIMQYFKLDHLHQYTLVVLCTSGGSRNRKIWSQQIFEPNFHEYLFLIRFQSTRGMASVELTSER